MPKARKSKTNLLPKCERHHAPSKILILPSVSTPSPSPPSSFPILTAPLPAPSPRPSETPKHPNFPQLDDESLSKLLVYAGPATILSALKVSTQWRRVALDLLYHVSRVDVGKVYTIANRRITPPTELQLVSMLTRFPALHTLSVQRWPYHDIMEHVATVICTKYLSHTLRDVELLGVPIKGTDLVTLLQNCPAVSTLRLGEHATIDDSLLKELALHCERARALDNAHTFHTITISQAPKVSQFGLAVLLASVRPDTLLSTRCKGVKALTWSTVRQTPTQRVSLAGCPNLTSVNLQVEPHKSDVLALNLSQCHQLYELVLSGTNLGAGHALALKQLNLSGCRRLRRIVVSANENAWEAFRNLEELILFGAYSVDSRWFERTFGLSQQVCTLPKLRRLNVNGCRLDVLKLNGYENLTVVDCSGCSNLDTLEIRECWILDLVVMRGKRMPLNTVELTLPTKCRVQGLRREWHWESHRTNQTITYP